MVLTYQLVRRLANNFRVSERNYRAWIKRYDRLGKINRQIFLEQVDQMAVKPFSILMPIYNRTLPTWMQPFNLCAIKFIRIGNCAWRMMPQP